MQMYCRFLAVLAVCVMVGTVAAQSIEVTLAPEQASRFRLGDVVPIKVSMRYVPEDLPPPRNIILYVRPAEAIDLFDDDVPTNHPEQLQRWIIDSRTPHESGYYRAVWNSPPEGGVDATLSMRIAQPFASALSLDYYATYLLGNEQFTTPVKTASTRSNWPPHDLDYNPADWIISLFELLRCIQMYNYGQGYSCALDTEDSFALGGGDTSCRTHDADTNRDWAISLGELLRVVQLYNTPGFISQEGTEDGYGPLLIPVSVTPYPFDVTLNDTATVTVTPLPNVGMGPLTVKTYSTQAAPGRLELMETAESGVQTYLYTVERPDYRGLVQFSTQIVWPPGAPARAYTGHLLDQGPLPPVKPELAISGPHDSSGLDTYFQITVEHAHQITLDEAQVHLLTTRTAQATLEVVRDPAADPVTGEELRQGELPPQAYRVYLRAPSGTGTLRVSVDGAAALNFDGLAADDVLSQGKSVDFRTPTLAVSLEAAQEDFAPGGEVTLKMHVESLVEAPIASIAASISVPAGWSHVSNTFGAPIFRVTNHAIEVAWIAPPTLPGEFFVVLRAPDAAAQLAQFSCEVLYSHKGDSLRGVPAVAELTLPIAEGPPATP